MGNHVDFSNWWESKYPSPWGSPEMESAARNIARSAWFEARSTSNQGEAANSAVALKMREALEDIARGPLQGPGDFIKYAIGVAQKALEQPCLSGPPTTTKGGECK